jgi:hypothetical protein
MYSQTSGALVGSIPALIATAGSRLSKVGPGTTRGRFDMRFPESVAMRGFQNPGLDSHQLIAEMILKYDKGRVGQ